MSSVDSEDDSHEGNKTPQKSKRDSKYKCPADFVSYKYKSSASALLDSTEHTEMWLIKAPVHFNPESLAGLKVSLSGLKTVQSRDGPQSQIYSVLGSSAGPPDLHLLSSSRKDQNVSLSASAFSGVLSISESYGDCSGNQGHIPIPALPAPSIPAGLRQRFQPFGSSTPTHTASDSPSSSKRAKLDAEESDEQRKKKKKKKKEKHNREDSIETVPVKQEPISYDNSDLNPQEAAVEEGTLERKKKKKVKKEKGERQDEGTVDASLIAKEEPMDNLYVDVDTPVKKKKKKKKNVDE